MKVSIVVPVYNTEAYLDECIQSVLQQTVDSWELILVDDGSTDGSGEICRLYAEKYPEKVFVYSKSNEGQLKTRLYGATRATGAYVGFLDSDDVLANHYVERLSACHDQYPDADIICFGARLQQEGETVRINSPIENGTDIFFSGVSRTKVYEDMIDGSLWGSMCSKLYKRELVVEQAVDSMAAAKRFGEDQYQSYAALAVAEGIVYLGDILYEYRIGTGGFSTGYDWRDLDYFNTRYVKELIERNLARWGVDDEIHRSRLYAYCLNEMVNTFLKYYRNAPDHKRRKAVLRHTWAEYLLPGSELYFENNPYIRQSYLTIWQDISHGRYLRFVVNEKIKKIKGRVKR